MAKKIKHAAALKRENGEGYRLLGKGQGYIAEKIIVAAKTNKIPIYNQPELAFLLQFSKIGRKIPEILYDIVKKVLTYLNEIDNISSER